MILRFSSLWHQLTTIWEHPFALIIFLQHRGGSGGQVVSVLAIYSKFESRWRLHFYSVNCLKRTKWPYLCGFIICATGCNSHVPKLIEPMVMGLHLYCVFSKILKTSSLFKSDQLKKLNWNKHLLCHLHLEIRLDFLTAQHRFLTTSCWEFCERCWFPETTVPSKIPPAFPCPLLS